MTLSQASFVIFSSLVFTSAQIMRRGVPMELVSADRLTSLVAAIEAEKEAEAEGGKEGGDKAQ